ncbi:hypothetical protein SEA_SPOOKY_82 [Gordonia phage Spooky]|nr:hypothetical protein SEA_SPOOKY_82 [Gordonia phage Spooky]
MSDDVRADARRLLQGTTRGPWKVNLSPGMEHDSHPDICVTAGNDEYRVVCDFSSTRQDHVDAEFIAASPTLVDRLLAELDRERDRALRLAIRATGCEKAETERDAALAVIAQVRDLATDVDLYGGHSGPALARTILNTVGGEK